jgi:hypothetical protein
MNALAGPELYLASALASSCSASTVHFSISIEILLTSQTISTEIKSTISNLKNSPVSGCFPEG